MNVPWPDSGSIEPSSGPDWSPCVLGESDGGSV